MLGRVLLPAILVAAVVAIVLVAVGQMGSASGSARTEREVVTAGDGVVQKTVAGTGDVEPVTDEDVDFQTSGTLAHVYVKEGEYVRRGTLLATLDDATDALTVKQARATLTQARATLTSDRKTLADEADSSSDDTSADVADSASRTVEVDDDLATATTATTASPGATTTPSGTTTATTTDTTPTTSATTPATTGTTGTTGTTDTTGTTGSSGSSGTSSTGSSATGSSTTGSSTTGSSATGSSTGTKSSSSGSSTGSSSSGSTSSSTTVTDATIDSDKLAIDGDEATVREDETDLAETRLTAPVSGTITTLESIAPGATVSSGTDSSGSDSSDDSSGSSTAGAASDSGTGSSSTSTSDTSSSTFAEIDSLRHLSMTVSFTESDISELKVGQPATVTFDALSGVELAGKVTAVSSLGTTSDDVVSYDATITLDQYDARVKPGMSASATVIIKQGHGVTVPSSAVTGTGTLATVTEQVDGKDRTEKVIVGTRGSDEDLIVSGVKAGDRLVETETLPAEGSSASTATTSGSTATGATGGRGAGGFGGTGGGFGGGAAGGGPP